MQKIENPLRSLVELVRGMAAFVLQLDAESAAGAKAGDGRLGHEYDPGAPDTGRLFCKCGDGVFIRERRALVPGLQPDGDHPIGAAVAADIVLSRCNHGMPYLRNGVADAV